MCKKIIGIIHRSVLGYSSFVSLYKPHIELGDMKICNTGLIQLTSYLNAIVSSSHGTRNYFYWQRGGVRIWKVLESLACSLSFQTLCNLQKLFFFIHRESSHLQMYKEIRRSSCLQYLFQQLIMNCCKSTNLSVRLYFQKITLFLWLLQLFQNSEYYLEYYNHILAKFRLPTVISEVPSKSHYFAFMTSK